ncbi:MAG: hypothetical protein AB7K09_16760 [Planctomycetota bacterium]
MQSTDRPGPGGVPALIVGHPGHELRIHGWLCRERPVVHILTDGSGSAGVSRINFSRALLADAAATPGAVFGRLTDRDGYAAILGGDAGLFIDLVRELADDMIAQRNTFVVCDAAEGHNPFHDLCRAVAAAAARRAGLALFDFPLAGAPGGQHEGESIELQLDDAAFGRKLAAAGRYTSLAGELAAAVGAHGRDAFRVELLRAASIDDPLVPVPDPPFYETFGEQQVARGRFGDGATVIRYREHIAPLIRAILADGADA